MRDLLLSSFSSFLLLSGEYVNGIEQERYIQYQFMVGLNLIISYTGHLICQVGVRGTSRSTEGGKSSI